MLRRVYDIFTYMHIIISSPESKCENNDDVKYSNTFFKLLNAKVIKN
jgi:hypothetical protein